MLIDEHPIASSVRNASVIHIGHLTPRFEAETHTEHCAKLTLLREPVDRVLSAFYYHGHKTEDWQKCLQATQSAGDAKNEKQPCKLWWEYTNDVTRRFAAHGDGATWNSYVVEKYLKDDPLTLLSYQQAEATLAKFQFVCFIEDIRACISKLGRYYGQALKLPEDVVRNVNLKRGEVPDELKQRIAEHNWMDVKLYQWAQAKFEHKPPDMETVRSHS
jgi:hypothetical protein